MVFLVRETLTEEDRAAWQRLVDREKRSATWARRLDWILYGVIWAGWLTMRFFSLCCFFYPVTILRWIIEEDLSSLSWLVCVPLCAVLVGCGVRLLLLFPHSPGLPPAWCQSNFPPAEPPDDLVRAAFFGDGCFAFWNAVGKVRLGYSSIITTREDEGRFYLFMKDCPPLVLPKRGFAGGTPEDFRDFLEGEFGWPVERMQ